MRCEKGHKAATRQHILEVASKSFRRDGISAAGIAGIMGEAGLTNGAFYPHFASKEALVREALASALADQQRRLEEDQRTGMDLEGAKLAGCRLSQEQFDSAVLGERTA